MDAFLTSVLTVALAEMGDKTQLLALFLAARFANRWAIILGILVSTLFNHALSAWLGVWVGQFFTSTLGQWLVGASFIALGLWLLIPDQNEAPDGRFDRYGAFLATTILFFLAEIGDKTQIATVLLGAQFDSILWVMIGTTLGMMLANVPVVILGAWLLQRIPMKLAHVAAALVFIGVGLWQVQF
jgi:putative Ca2+/H+ antiporter (TMEM165/GDT1 family)